MGEFKMIVRAITRVFKDNIGREIITRRWRFLHSKKRFSLNRRSEFNGMDHKIKIQKKGVMSLSNAINMSKESLGSTCKESTEGEQVATDDWR